jgi:serine phosphatase RsbU (regulator of sigma subunit)
MDIALCSIDMENRILKFAGANRPLWIIRNGQTTLEEIKGTKNAIGGVNTNTSPDFDSYELKLQQGDTFYIFSDGYAYQFGGELEKKMTTKKFKELLLNLQNITMNQQGKYLDNYIEDWKAGAEQVDDILVIGVRIA